MVVPNFLGHQMDKGGFGIFPGFYTKNSLGLGVEYVKSGMGWALPAL